MVLPNDAGTSGFSGSLTTLKIPAEQCRNGRQVSLGMRWYCCIEVVEESVDVELIVRDDGRNVILDGSQWSSTPRICMEIELTPGMDSISGK